MARKKLTKEEMIEMVEFYKKNGWLKTAEMYNLKPTYGNVTVAISNIREKLGISVPRGRGSSSKEKKMEMLKYYQKHGVEKTAKRYNLKKSSVNVMVILYVKELGIVGFKTHTQLNTEKNIKNIKENGTKKAAISLGMTISSACRIKRENLSTDYTKRGQFSNSFIKNEFYPVYLEKGSIIKALDHLGISREMKSSFSSRLTRLNLKRIHSRHIVSDEKKLEIIKFYIKNGAVATNKKYNIKNSEQLANKYADSIGYPKPLIRKLKPKMSKEKKLEIIKYYEKYGAKKTAEKYGYADSNSATSAISTFAKQLHIKYITHIKRFNKKEIEEMREFLKTHSRQEFEAKYETDYYSFKHAHCKDSNEATN